MPKNNEFANKVNNSNHVSTSAHDTGNENVFADAKVTGVIPDGTFKLNPKYQYCIVSAEGNCLDHELSPIRIKDGDRLLIHEIPLDEFSLLSTVRKVVCIVLTDGRCFVKQMVFYDGISNGIRLRMFNPEEERFFVPIPKIKALFVVDKALSAEYVNQLIKPLPGKCGYFDGAEITDVTPIKETTLEDVKQYAQERNKVMKNYVLKQMAIHGLKNLPVGELQTGLFIMGCDNPHEEMINMITQYSNCMAQAWECYIKVIAMEKQQQETIMI